jgi:formylglycine-generating enzyme required for sulfatase activity
MDKQGLMGVFDRGAISDESFTDSRDDEDIAITSQSASEAPSELPSEITDSYDHVMVLVPAGEFEMGADAEVVFGEFQKLVDPEYWDVNLLLSMEPVHTVNLDDYYIDKFEVTNAQYAEFLNEQGNQQESGAAWLNDQSDDALIFLNSGSWQSKEGYGDHPVIQVTWYGARAYCQWRGARLPSEAEWEKAARGTDGRLYPWGSDYDGGRLNVCDSNCPFPFAISEHDDGYFRTAPVNTYSDGVSPYGIFNMTGNVSEWVEDWLDIYPGGDPESSDSFGRVQRVKRGGSWSTTGAVGTTFRVGVEPDEAWPTIGFRCSRSP